MRALTILAILAMAATLNAATLRWDVGTGDIKGYTARYTDGTNNYNKSFDGALTEIPDMEVFFNLKFNTNYVFTLEAYNDAGKSAVSLPTDSFTRTSYSPPADVIPIDVLEPPTEPLNPTWDL